MAPCCVATIQVITFTRVYYFQDVIAAPDSLQLVTASFLQIEALLMIFLCTKFQEKEMTLMIFMGHFLLSLTSVRPSLATV